MFHQAGSVTFLDVYCWPGGRVSEVSCELPGIPFMSMSSIEFTTNSSVFTSCEGGFFLNIPFPFISSEFNSFYH